MKICYLANAESVHTQRWAQHFRRRGYHVTVVSFQPGEIDEVRVLQPPHLTCLRRVDILLRLGAVRRLVREVDSDILHAHYATSYGLAGALAGRHPLIVTAWGSDVLIMPEESWIYRQVVRFALGRADLVTSMAEHMTQHLIERGYAKADKVITLPFGVDTDIFNLNQRVHPHRSGSGIVVSTRRLDPQLDVDTLIRAIPKVLDACPGTRFLLVGNGPLRPQLQRLAVDLGVASNTEFLGQIAHREMPGLLGRTDVFVTTSPSDGNNVSLNEAMACGAFPVATDIPANRAWLEHGRNGLIVSCRDVGQLADAIIEALHKPEWRQAVMMQNWEIIHTHASWSYWMDEMERHYDKLLQRTEAGGSRLRNTRRASVSEQPGTQPLD